MIYRYHVENKEFFTLRYTRVYLCLRKGEKYETKN